MRNKNIGKIIYTLRTCNHISQEKLARGLCSVAALSRIEACERVPDKLLLDALLQRLGKSPDKLESIITVGDYELYLYREKIQGCIIDENYEEAKALLDMYAQKKEAEEKVHKQYILKIKAALSKLADKDIAASEKYIEEAVKITMPDGTRAALENSLLSVSEIQLILMRISQYQNKNEDEQVWEVLSKLNIYVREHYTDEEELVKIYIKIARAEARILMERKQYDKAVKVCESALDLLGKNGVLINYHGILFMLIEGLEHLNEPEKLAKMKKWRDTLNKLYEEYSVHPIGENSFLFAESSQCEILLVNELIQRGRKTKGFTQEKLSEDICTPENLSAIESGKRAPSIKHYDKIMEKLGMHKDFYNSFLSAELFEIHELRRECNRLIYLRKFMEAEKILEKITELIDTGIPINEQYILYNKVLVQEEQEKMNVEEALNEVIKALELTFNYNDGNFKTDVILAQEEVKIINYICTLYRKMNQTEKAIAVYRKVVESYQSSKVSERGHYTGYNLIMANLCISLEETNQIEESMQIARQGITQALNCGRGSLLPDFLANLACCFEKMDNKKACGEYLQQAFYMSDMMKNDFFNNAIKKYYEDRYEKIVWY